MKTSSGGDGREYLHKNIHKNKYFHMLTNAVLDLENKPRLMELEHKSKLNKVSFLPLSFLFFLFGVP